MIKVGSVIQANESAQQWCGCLLIVNEVTGWGVKAGLKIPFQGTAYIRLNHNQYDLIGKAVLIESEEEENG